MNLPNQPVAQPPPLEPPLPENLDTKSLIEALLRRPHELVERLAEGAPRAASRFALLAVGCVVLFGLVLGCFAKHEQLWAAPLKVAAGMLVAGVICLPSLYIFATLAGARVTVSQVVACMAGALTLAGLLLLGCAPAVWIFAESTDSFGFMGALAIGAWIVAVGFALRFLKAAVVAAGGTQRGPLAIWGLVFLLVTLQMSTSLRPILGRSPGQFLTQEKKFFLQHWADYFGKSLEPQAAASRMAGNLPPPAATPPAGTARTTGGSNPFLEQ